MPFVHSSSPESSSDSLPPGSFSHNKDVKNSLNTTMISTVNNYFANFPGQSSMSRQGFPPPSRSGFASISDIAEGESVGTSGRGGLRAVRFSEDIQSGRQERRRKTHILAYEYDMDAPGGIDASDAGSCASRKSSVETLGLMPTKSRWALVPVTVKNFNSSKTIPQKIRAYMRSDFFNSEQSIALWTPSPGVNHDPKITQKHIAIGDVGVFTVQGGFEVFFNIFMTKEDNEEYGYHPPPDFTPCTMVTKGSIHKDPLSDVNLVRGNFTEVRCDGYTFSCETPCTRWPLEGTALVLPMGGWKFHFKLQTLMLIRSYLNVHAGSWYRYYRSPISGPMLPTGSLKIVSTTYKTGTWAYAVGMKDLTTQDKRLFANLARPDKDEDVFKWKQHSQDVSVNTGPSTVEMDGGKATLINQCVAVEVFAIKPTPLLSAVNTTLSRLSLYLSQK